jgi:type II secretory pathway predicted ATPase ExeA
MNSKKLLSLYGLKWNPFSPEIPVEGLLVTPRIESFLWRVENLLADGGFALLSGDPGNGKSATLRMLAERLRKLRDVVVGVVTRPQSRTSDFYREMGDLFGVKLNPANRYGGFKALRERWKTYLQSSLIKPIVLVDEAQDMPAETLNELRILASADFDSTTLLTVILGGDGRLIEKLKTDDLAPLGSRLRVRLHLEYASKDELRNLLEHAVSTAGNASLMTQELIHTLVDHAAGNPRTLMSMAAELLACGIAKEVTKLDEKLYLEVFGNGAVRKPAKEKRA